MLKKRNICRGALVRGIYSSTTRPVPHPPVTHTSNTLPPAPVGLVNKMRRPRAFTSSKMRAEPLPPPPRKPLGYTSLNEEGWATIRRSSSPCKCGTCIGLDSPSTFPAPTRTPHPDQIRLPESLVTNVITNTTTAHSLEQKPAGSPLRTEATSANTSYYFDSPTREASRLSRTMTARRLQLPRGGVDEDDAAPSRRIVFNTQPHPHPHPHSKPSAIMSAGPNVGIKDSVGSSERKRGSDRNDSGGLYSYGNFPAASVISFASGCPAGSGISGINGGSSGRDFAATPTALNANWNAAAAAGGAVLTTEATSISGSELVWNCLPEVETVKCIPVSFVDPNKKPSAVFDVCRPSPSSSASHLRADSIWNNGGSPSGSPSGSSSIKDMEEWKAPETDGIFSLGASSRASGFGRHRRMLRMRVAG